MARAMAVWHGDAESGTQEEVSSGFYDDAHDDDDEEEERRPEEEEEEDDDCIILAEVAGVVSRGEEEAPEGNSLEEELPNAASKEDEDFPDDIDATEGGSPYDEDATEGDSPKDIDAMEGESLKDIKATENEAFPDEGVKEGESPEDIDATEGESSEVLDATVLYETCHEESSGVENPSASAIEEKTVFKDHEDDDDDDDKEEDLDRITSARGAGSEICADNDSDAVASIASEGGSPSPESKDPLESENWPPIAHEEDSQAAREDHVKGFRKRSRSLSEDEVETKFRVANVNIVLHCLYI